MMNKTFKALSLMLLMSFLMTVFCECRKKPEESEVVRPVYTMTVGGPGAGPSRSFSGVARAQKEIILSFRIGGQITQLDIKVGKEVRPGDVIARLDPKDAELQVSQKKASLMDSEAKQQEAKANYERVRKLYESGSSSAAELDSALANYRSSKANQEAAQKDLELAQQQLSYTTLLSSVEGEIIKKTAEVFETVAAGQEIGKMVTGDEMEMEIGVPEGIVNYLRIGMPASIIFESLPGATFQSRVTELGRSPTEATTYPVKLLILNPDVRIRPGMAGEATFEFGSEEQGERIVLPASVVVGLEAERYVWVVDPKTQTVSKRDVVVGQLSEDGLVIKSGLKKGEIVVTRGVHRLEEGEKVKPIEDR